MRSASEVGTESFSAAQFVVIDTVAGLGELAADWNELFATCGRPTQVFQTHAFAALWARTYLGADTTRLAIVTARVDGRLVMVLPLVIDRSLGVTTLAWLGAPIAQYGDMLIAPEHAGDAIIDAAWSHIRTVLRPDLMRLRKVRADATVAPFLRRLGALEMARDAAPFVTLAADRGGSFEDLQSGKARKNRRRQLRRLEEQGSTGFEHHAGSATAAELARAAIAIKRRWLADRALYSSAFADERIDEFFAAAAADSETGCNVFALMHDGRPIGVALGFSCQRRMTLHVIGYDLAFERSGAGALALEAVLRHCEAEGFSAVDLLAPKAEYKMDWADGTVVVIDWAVPVTLKGQACVKLYDGCLRPQAKATIERLPAGLRQLITRPAAAPV